MSSLVGALRAMLSLDSTAFVSGTDKALRSKRRLEGGLVSLAATARKVAIGMAAVGAGLAVAVKRQLNAFDDLGKAAQKFGVGVEELSRLKYAADLSDVSLDTLGTSLRTLSKNMVDAMNGVGSKAEMFSQIGVSVTDAAGQMRSTEAVLQDVADVIAKMPDGAEKTALAMKLFGKSGSEMIPMLNGGKSSLAAMAEEAQKLGIVIDEKTAKAAEAFNDNLTRLSTAAGGLVAQLAAALAPTLEKISEFAVQIAISFAELSPETKELIVQLGSILGVVAGASIVFGALSLVLNPVSIAIAAIAAAAALIYENWDGIATWFLEQWASIRQSTEEAWAAIKSAIGGAITYVTGLWDAFVAKLNAAIQIAKNVGKAISDALTSGDTTASDTLAAAGLTGPAATAQFTNAGINLGFNLGYGITQGIFGSSDDAAAAAGAMATKVESAAKTALEVQSPSQVFRRIGQFVTEGFALGIRDNVPLAEQAIDEVGSAIEGRADSFKTAFEGLKSTMEGAFVGLVTGAMSFKQALSQVIAKLAEMLAQSAFQSLMGAGGGNGLLGGLLGLFGFAKGGVFDGGRVTAFASGGVINGATAFAMQGGLGVMGEAGPEAIMPLARGKGGKLGVVAQGGGFGRMQIEIVENPMFAARVEGIADGRAVAVVQRYDRDLAPISRQRPGRERG